jgi:hypothetical protein
MCGGYETHNYLGSFIYNFTTGKLENTPDMLKGHNSHGLTIVNGFAYVFAGYTMNERS